VEASRRIGDRCFGKQKASHPLQLKSSVVKIVKKSPKSREIASFSGSRFLRKKSPKKSADFLASF
jgi:hypothetical protein